MKLGDNMTMEACNLWGDVCPRKCRPPRIGDIPKHGAVDQESPSSSTGRLTISPLEPPDTGASTPTTGSTNERNVVFPLGSAVATSPRTAEPQQNLLIVLEKDKELYSTKSTRLSETIIPRSNPRLKEEGIGELFAEPGSQITIKLSTTSSNGSAEYSSNSLERQDSLRVSSSPEEVPDSEILEVRKDSALFLEEAEGLPTLREILKSRAPRIIRPRRESSGYASNLGTFDEDRRNSSTADVLQDLSLFLKERRRSSTKRLSSRIPLCRAEESLGEEVNIGSSSSVERMPTTEIHRKVSSAGLEMPDIQEVKEITKDEASFKPENIEDLCALVGSIGVEELSTRCRFLGDLSNHKISSGKEDRPSARDLPRSTTYNIAGSHTSSECSVESAKFRKKVVHQASSPTFGDLDRSAAVRKPSERLPARQAYDRSSLQLKIDDQLEQFRKSQREPLEEEAVQTKCSERRINEISRAEGLENRERHCRRTVKMYQLLSTRSEDRSDELRYDDRRISLQISGGESSLSRTSTVECDERLSNIARTEATTSNATIPEQRHGSETASSTPVRKLSSPGEMGAQRFLGDAGSVTVRPIYPYCPYSPYGSPQGSPRNRRRPLRESRRVSIDNRQGALQLNQYKLLDNIGQGSYGIVKLAYNEEDETHYAMKILSKKKLMKKAGIFGRMAPGKKGPANPLAKVYREIALLKKLDHPNVVKLVEVLDDPDEDNLYLVFELVQKGEVLQIPTDKPLDEEAARKIFRDVVMGVEYLHYQRIVHRDIKPSNLLVDSEGRIKIADLGVSAELRASGELLSGPAGTPAFAAPETTTPGGHYSGTLCDVWSMGVTLYSLVTGKLPWDGAGSIIGVQAAVRSEPLKFPENPSLSESLRDMIKRMLAKDPAERITLSEMKGHEWLTNRGTNPLPTEADNCRLPVTVTDEEVERVVTRVPKLDTLILIKTMLKQHSFQNPFLPKRTGRTIGNEADSSSLELSVRRSDSSLQQTTLRSAKTERFHRSGRSNSAPDSYDWQANGRQISVDSPLPPVTEASSQEAEIEKR